MRARINTPTTWTDVLNVKYSDVRTIVNAYMSTESVTDSSTKVTWGFNGRMDYPMNLMLLTMNMDEMLGKDLQEGLVNLKANLEK